MTLWSSTAQNLGEDLEKLPPTHVLGSSQRMLMLGHANGEVEPL
jgi:hypothetical protein